MYTFVKYTLAISLLFLSFSGSGQNRYEDPDNTIVSYADGSIFIGKVIEETDKETIMKIATGDTIRLDNFLIRREIQLNRDVIMHQKGKFHFKSGYFFGMEYGIGMSENGDPSTNLNFYVGKRLNTRLAAGINAGLHFNNSYVYLEDEIPNQFGDFVYLGSNLLSFSAFGRYYFNNKRIRPFVYSNLGWSIPVSGYYNSIESKGGLHFQAGLGLHFASRRRSRFILSAGQYLQKSSGVQLNFDQIRYEYDIWYNKLAIRFAWEFN
ncbi:MAG: hypothetical protein AAFO94_03600 [Bacteroidota bacterium]